jgi:hypothetical protein
LLHRARHGNSGRVKEREFKSPLHVGFCRCDQPPQYANGPSSCPMSLPLPLWPCACPACCVRVTW